MTPRSPGGLFIHMPNPPFIWEYVACFRARSYRPFAELILHRDLNSENPPRNQLFFSPKTMKKNDFRVDLAQTKPDSIYWHSFGHISCWGGVSKHLRTSTNKKFFLKLGLCWYRLVCHDAVRRIVCWLARRVGLKAEEEKNNILVLGPSGMRADVVVHKRTPLGPLLPYKT